MTVPAHDEEACHLAVGILQPNLRSVHDVDSRSTLGVEAKARLACVATLEWFGVLMGYAEVSRSIAYRKI